MAGASHDAITQHDDERTNGQQQLASRAVASQNLGRLLRHTIHGLIESATKVYTTSCVSSIREMRMR